MTNLMKQNDGMESSFINRGIVFEKPIIDENDSPENKLCALTNYNNYLKTISKNNRPVVAVFAKESVPTVAKEPIVKEEEEEEEDIKEVKPVYSTITNMEDIKRACFNINKEYDLFRELVKQHPFKFYTANYKYSEDNNGRPAYIAKNLLRGFVQNLDDYRKNLLVCFRCFLQKTETDTDTETSKYLYPSVWIVNSNDDIATILGSYYDDFDFTVVDNEQGINDILQEMEKRNNEEDETLIGEIYVH